MSKSKKYNRKTPTKSILHIRNSKSKSNKHKKRGNLGKDCIYYNHDKLTCTCFLSPYNHTLCKMCNCFKSNKIKKTDNENNVYIDIPIQAGIHERTNEYISVSKNIGTPYHVGYMKSNEPRRHKARCVYYQKENKMCKHYLYKCVGSTRCEKYEERKRK